MFFQETSTLLYFPTAFTFSGASGFLSAFGTAVTDSLYPLFQVPLTDCTFAVYCSLFTSFFSLNDVTFNELFLTVYVSCSPLCSIRTSYPVTFLHASQVSVNSSLPVSTARFVGISISGFGIRFSIPFTNSTLEISARLLLFCIPWIVSVTFFTAI